jgi:DNA-binding GntR family transcriptional regulator
MTRLTTVERLAGELRSAISAGTLTPGEPLREEELSRQYLVSRHVLRAALRALVNEGLAQYEAYKGARVVSISDADIADIYRAREIIEASGLRNVDAAAAERLALLHSDYSAAVREAEWDRAFSLDIAFHRELASCAGSATLTAVHSNLFRRLELAHLIRDSFRGPGHIASVSEHAEIIVALAANSAEAAVAALSRHLERARMSLSDGTADSA